MSLLTINFNDINLFITALPGDLDFTLTPVNHLIERYFVAYRIKMAHLNETDRIQILMMPRLMILMDPSPAIAGAHPERPIVRSAVTKIVAKFQTVEHVRDLPKSGRPPVPENIQLDVMIQVQDNPHSTTRHMGIDLNLSHTSVRNILHKQKFHPYKITLMQELSEADFDRRNEFCEIMQIQCKGDENFAGNILFPDEASLFLIGTLNRHNCQHWAAENPHWIQEAHTQHPQKVNVWAGMIKNRLIGPNFIDGNLNGQQYLAMLQTQVVGREAGDSLIKPARQRVR
ncbi:hypothetical protein NQ318_002848 [Aromia moschata]|uniref:Transposase n=1 Tax=Aromia moschata TaxID=1265417 RepID=A0AAV8XT00_9CUCU|nr:hypothetical protein NQ318_002848 [Aromia moschata]